MGCIKHIFRWYILIWKSTWTWPLQTSLASGTSPHTSCQIGTKRMHFAVIHTAKGPRPIADNTRAHRAQSAESSTRTGSAKPCKPVKQQCVHISAHIPNLTQTRKKNTYQLHLRHVLLHGRQPSSQVRIVNGHEIVAIHQHMHELIHCHHYSATAIRATGIIQCPRCPHNNRAVMMDVQERDLILFPA